MSKESAGKTKELTDAESGLDAPSDDELPYTENGNLLVQALKTGYIHHRRVRRGEVFQIPGLPKYEYDRVADEKQAKRRSEKTGKHVALSGPDEHRVGMPVAFSPRWMRVANQKAIRAQAVRDSQAVGKNRQPVPSLLNTQPEKPGRDKGFHSIGKEDPRRVSDSDLDDQGTTNDLPTPAMRKARGMDIPEAGASVGHVAIPKTSKTFEAPSPRGRPAEGASSSAAGNAQEQAVI